MRNYFRKLAKSPFIEGVARIFDWGGTLSCRDVHADNGHADYLAIEMDWKVVGGDMHKAVTECQKDLVNRETCPQSKEHPAPRVVVPN